MKKLKNSIKYNDLKSINEYKYVTISHLDFEKSNIKNSLIPPKWIDSTIKGPSEIFINSKIK